MSLKILTDAIRQRRSAEIESLLRENALLANTPDDGGEYPLHHAGTFGNSDAARLLIAAGADVHARERSYHTPLSWAIIEGAHDVAHVLIENGATYDLWVAAALGDRERVNSFFESNGKLKPGASVHGVTRVDESGAILPKPPSTDSEVLSDAFYIACTNGRVDIATLIHQRGLSNGSPVDLEFRTHGLNTPLHEACYFGHADVVELLLQVGANRAVINRRGMTPLDIAMKACNQEIADKLRKM